MLRNLTQADLQAILAIEQSAHVVPWTEDTFKTCFQAGHVGWVLEVEKKVIGFIIVSLRAEECHILNLCIARASQHQGFGRKLLLHALQHSRSLGIGIVYLEVRRTNSRAIALYTKEKFIEIGVRKGYYPTVGGNEDALIFARSLQVTTY